MIAKMSSGSSIYGALSYNLEKVNAQQAKVICTNQMQDSGNGIYDMPACLRSFQSRLVANQKTEKPVLHLSLNPEKRSITNLSYSCCKTWAFMPCNEVSLIEK